MNWTCPYCQHDQVVSSDQRTHYTSKLAVGINKYGDCGVTIVALACANAKCGEVSLTVSFGAGDFKPGPGGALRFKLEDKQAEWHRLRPASFAKPQPEAVPSQLANDYYEACSIRDLSPKASATLSRRALQGMIRDFCRISKRTLYEEIEALKKMSDGGTAPQGVAIETIEAMHHIRSIGNIGAHMENDIDVIVDVDAGEAQALIELIEMLFEDWYIERAQRQKKLEGIRAIASAKEEAKKQKPAKQP